MYFKKEKDKEKYVVIPQHISKYGVYTGHCLLAVSFQAFYQKYTGLGVLLFLLYTTTILHWRKVYNKSIIKTLDVITVAAVVTKISFHDSIRWKNYRKLWFYCLIISGFAHLANHKLFYTTIVKNQEKNYKDKSVKLEKIYYINVFVHTFFLHIFIPFTASYCALMTSIT